MAGQRGTGRRLAWIGLLVMLALLRAEQGVAELQGRPGAVGRLFRLAPADDGRWQITLLGHEWALETRVVLVEGRSPLLQGQDARQWLRALARPAGAVVPPPAP